MDKEWLKNLKVGDKVLVNDNYGKTLCKVQRITPTGRIVVDGVQFINGVHRYSDWLINTLEQATDEAIIKYNQTKFAKSVLYSLNNLQSITYEQARQINKILNLGVKE